MKNFKKRKLNEASKKTSKKTSKKASKKTSTRRVKSTDPGEPDSPTAEDEIRAAEEEAREQEGEDELEREWMEDEKYEESSEYHRLGYVLAEALRVEDEEPKSSNAYVMALNTIKEDSRVGGRYGSGVGSRRVEGWTPPTPLPKKKPEETTATTPKPKKKKMKGSR